MKLNGGDVEDSDGTGVRTENEQALFFPLVRMTTRQDQRPDAIVLHLTPDRARRIGLDLIAASSMAWADTGMRNFAREHGLDGDGLVGTVTALVKVALKEEGP